MGMRDGVRVCWVKGREERGERVGEGDGVIFVPRDLEGLWRRGWMVAMGEVGVGKEASRVYLRCDMRR